MCDFRIVLQFFTNGLLLFSSFSRCQIACENHGANNGAFRHVLRPGALARFEQGLAVRPRSLSGCASPLVKVGKHISRNICIRVYNYIQALIYVYICIVYMHQRHMFIYVHKYIQIHAHTYVYAYVDAFVYVYMDTRVRTQHMSIQVRLRRSAYAHRCAH